MTSKDFRDGSISGSPSPYQGEVTEDTEPDLDNDIEEFSAESIVAAASQTVIVTLDRDVVVDGEFVFPLDYNWMNLLLWRPGAVGVRLKGTYQGCIYYNWSDDDDIPADKYHLVRVDGADRVIPAWSAVDKALDKIGTGTEVLLIFGGTVQLKNGRTFHRILVGANVKTNNPLVD